MNLLGCRSCSCVNFGVGFFLENARSLLCCWMSMPLWAMSMGGRFCPQTSYNLFLIHLEIATMRSAFWYAEMIVFCTLGFLSEWKFG